MEFEREVVNGGAELRPAGAVPRNDRIEAAQCGDQLCRRREFQHVEAGGSDGAGPVGEAGQRQVLRSGPNLYVISL